MTDRPALKAPSRQDGRRGLPSALPDPALSARPSWYILRDENAMIHHPSIAARDPQHVAEVLAEFMGGAATRFTPNPGSWFAHQHDEYGTGVEVYPAGTELRPAGPEGAGFAMTEPIRPGYNPFRAQRPDLSGTDRGDRGARRLAVLLLRAGRRRLPCDGSLDREYRDDRAATSGLHHRISDVAWGARGLTPRRPMPSPRQERGTGRAPGETERFIACLSGCNP